MFCEKLQLFFLQANAKFLGQNYSFARECKCFVNKFKGSLEKHNHFVREREWIVRECKCFPRKNYVSQGNTIVCHRMQIFCETANIAIFF